MTKADTLYPSDPNELKTVVEVAKATGRTPASILQFIQKGILPAMDQKLPNQRGRPRKMIRAGDIFLIAFRPRWENRSKAIKTSTGTTLHPTTLPEN